MVKNEPGPAGPGHVVIQQLLTAFAQRKTMEPAAERRLVSSHEATSELLCRSARPFLDRNVHEIARNRVGEDKSHIRGRYSWQLWNDGRLYQRVPHST
jgi:hypothetical protein